MSHESSAFPIQTLWHKLQIPDLSASPQAWEDSVFADVIPQVRRVGVENSDIIVPDPKAVRSMSRASLFLSSWAEEMKSVLMPFLEKSPFSVGIYCAVENGPIDGPSTAEILKRNTSGEFDFVFAEAYRKLRNPKMYLKQLPNLVPAQLGISLGVQGPMNVYTHSIFGAEQALNQAYVDLLAGTVEAALVVSAHAFDDFWVVKRTRKQDARVICEGAAGLILSRNSDYAEKNVKNTLNSMKKSSFHDFFYDAENYFGISDPLVNLIRKREGK